MTNPIDLRIAQSRKLYGNPLDSAVSQYTESRVRQFVARGDRENAQKARAEGPRLLAWAQRHNIAPQDLLQALAVQRECEQLHDARPVTAEALATKAARTAEQLRLQHGSSEKSQAVIKRFVGLTTSLAQELPELAARANETGSGADIRVVHALSSYGPEAA